MYESELIGKKRNEIERVTSFIGSYGGRSDVALASRIFCIVQAGTMLTSPSSTA